MNQKRIRGEKPTVKQAVVLKDNGMDHRDWYIKKVYLDRLVCIHRCSGDIKDAFFNTVAK